MYKFLVVILVLIMAPVGATRAQDISAAMVSSTFEDKVVKIFVLNCISSLAITHGEHEIAVTDDLVPIPSEQAGPFSSHGGMVFRPKTFIGKVILFTAPKIHGCNLSAQDIQPDKIIPLLDLWFGKKTPFKLIEEKKNDGTLDRIYTADINGNLAVRVSIGKNKSNANVMLLMAAPYKGQPPHL